LLLAALLLCAGCSGSTNVNGEIAADKSATVKPVKPPSDSTPPAAVDDLAVEGTTFYSITLAWTATGDDGYEGQADGYDVRFSTVPINDGNWDDASRASYEPAPGPPGTTETFTMYGVLRNTTYYLALKVDDEAGNWSDLSNVVQAATDDEPYTWDIQLVEDSCIIWLHSGAVDLAYDPIDGNPSVVYNDAQASSHKFAHWTGSSWEKDVIGDGETGYVNLAFDPTEPNTDRNPVLCLGAVHLISWDQSSQSWISEQDGSGGDFSMAYAPGDDHPSISCVTSSGVNKKKTWALELAEWDGSAWVFDYIAPGYGTNMCTIRDTSLVFDGSAAALIAYRDELDSVQPRTVALRFARRAAGSSTWDIETVDQFTEPHDNAFANISNISIACDPVTGNPGIAYWAYIVDYDLAGWPHVLDELRFASWNGSSWDIHVVDDDGRFVGLGASLAYASSGMPAIGYYTASYELVKLASWDGSSWNIEIVDSGLNFDGNVPLAFDPDGKPSIVMQTHIAHSLGLPEQLFFARKL